MHPGAEKMHHNINQILAIMPRQMVLIVFIYVQYI